MAFSDYNSTKSYAIGKGKLYFARTGEGYVYLGNAPGLTINGELDLLEHFSSTSGVGQKDDEVARTQNRGGSITVDSITSENMALLFGGTFATHSQANTAVTDEAITVQTGQFYQLGETTSNTPGVRNVSSVVIQDDTDTTTYTEGTDYELDAALGLIYIIPGGSISDSDVLHVDYTPASETRDRITSGSNLSVDGKLLFKADNPKGDNRDIHCPDVTLSPEGDYEVIGEEWQQITFAISVNEPSTGEAAVYVDGRAA